MVRGPNTRGWRQTIGTGLLLTMLLGGCTFDRGTLSIHLVQSSQSDDDPLPDPDDAEAAGKRPEVTELRLRVEGPGMGVVERTFPYTGRGGEAQVPEVPVGSGRVVSVEGVGPTGATFSRGATVPLDIRPGQNTINVYIGRVGRFSATPAPMRQARAFHAAVPLGDSRLLLIGGTAGVTRHSVTEEGARVPFSVNEVVRTVEILDATSASFDPTPVDCNVALPRDCLREGRALAPALRLPDGILVAGGEDAVGPLADAELFDPGSRLFSPGGILVEARTRHAAAVVGDEGMLFGGTSGESLASTTEVFSEGRFSPGVAMTQREAATATPLGDGRVLVAGGRNAVGEVAVAEVFDGDSMVPVAPLNHARAYHTATLIPDGRVLIVGGLAEGRAVAAAEVFDPGTNTFAVIEAPMLERWAHAATPLTDGKVLVSGGFAVSLFGGASREVELLDPGSLQSGTGPLAGLVVTRLPPLREGRAGHTASTMGNGLVVVAGGVGLGGLDHAPLSSAEVLVPSR